jgi:hypothetical protein
MVITIIIITIIVLIIPIMLTYDDTTTSIASIQVLSSELSELLMWNGRQSLYFGPIIFIYRLKHHMLSAQD